MKSKKSKITSTLPPDVEFPHCINEYVCGPAGRQRSGDLKVIPLHQTKDGKLPDAEISPDIRSAIEAQVEDHLFSGAAGEVRLLRIKSDRFALIGLGTAPADRSAYRWAGARAAQAARNVQAPVAALHNGSIPIGDWAAAAAHMAEGAELGSFSFQHYKAAKATSANSNAPLKVHFIHATRNADFDKAVRQAVECCSATNFARHLANHPPNVINPASLVDICTQLAKSCGLKCRVIPYNEAQRLALGGLCSVGKGSPNKPALIILQHAPSTVVNRPPVAIVGKAVTFDTGGISIKPAADMGAMKYDKCGGMTAIGVAVAAALLKLPYHVVCAIPTAENSVDGDAYRPGDIIRMHNSKTVDITNTDAEGRLILADAISFVCQQYRPSMVIDLATLTGGVVTALGSVYAGLMSNHDKLAEHLIDAGNRTDELLWRLPLHPQYRKLLDSPHADMVNSGGREAHPIQGGMFLQEFVPAGTPWAHLDIAGVAHPKKENRYLKGDEASGFGVRLLVEFIKFGGHIQ